MNKGNEDALNFMVRRASKATGLSMRKVRAVFDSIADLRWDWEGSKYDLWGLQIEAVLKELGEERAEYLGKKDKCL